ncbi:recombinase family protein [Shimia abyssi]|uniref:DNA invertase Pin-like site-specific DNA recombinase n=1 Tax=Shimia abyssi TaxID=1662395 RepID=A0A2P8EZC9_9RHOB|nr:recombinase family protein [Shimia abyssi]PSL14822.1 DNA invertase Pin-like site-specific DNA recombinase [Shimia abyssi]
MRRIRCAVYTRKSSEEGLEQDFNSLHAQREACEAYITSQKQEGWEILPDHYDDGGISGGHLTRPALQRLMQAVDEKRVDQIVVYKIDRLTRSLADFAKLVDRLDAAETSFVSVTQSFNTATSMGRLTLNMLLSFAQFEREVTSERIRDKIAASKRKGMWMGGHVPLGYRADGRTLKIDETEAPTIQALYDLYRKLGSVRKVKDRADALGLRTRRRERSGARVSGGIPFDRGHLHHILSNPIYAGRIRHKGQVYDGQHPAIIDPQAWDRVQELLQNGAAISRGSRKKTITSPLAGKLFDETGDRLTPSHSRKNGKRLRYYVSRRVIAGGCEQHPDAWRLPAEQVEGVLTKLVGRHLGRPDAVTSMTQGLSAAEIKATAEKLTKCISSADCLNLIERVHLRPGAMRIQLDPQALTTQLECLSGQINASELTIEAPFQMRRRGVELKLHLGDPPQEVDKTLVRNIAKGRRWLAMIIDGKSFPEIAEVENVSTRRVQGIAGLALLAPDILDAITLGEQPGGLTTDYLIKTRFSAVWSEQRTQFAAL